MSGEFKLTKHVCYKTKPFQFYNNTLTATSEWVQLEIWKHANKLKIGHSVLHLANQGTKLTMKNVSNCKVKKSSECSLICNK